MTSPVRVVVAAPLPATFPRDAFESRIDLTEVRTAQDLKTAVRTAEVLYTGQVPDTIPAETDDLRWVQVPSAGVDWLRGLPIWSSTITITSARGIHTVPMAEHVFAMLLALVRNLPTLERYQAAGEWMHEGVRHDLRFTELRGKTMGIVGWGGVGAGVAHLAAAFGMRVLGTRWSIVVPHGVAPPSTAYADPPILEPVDPPPHIVYPAANLHAVLEESDVVVMILPLTGRTRGSFGPAEFRAMKRGSLFLNIGRGPVVVEEALIQALRWGRLAGAGLDVFSEEPLPVGSPLWSMPNVVITPHVGGFSDRTPARAAQLFAVNLSRYLDGEPLLNVVDRNEEY